MLSRSVVSDSATPWTVALQAPLSMEFPRQEYWSGLLFPPAGTFPDPGIKHASLSAPALAGGFFTTEPRGKPHVCIYVYVYTHICTHVHVYIYVHNIYFFSDSFPLQVTTRITDNPLCYIAGPCSLSIVYIVLCFC